MDKKILSISDAASILGVSDETLRNWEREGKLTPFHTEGGHRRYYRAGASAFHLGKSYKKVSLSDYPEHLIEKVLECYPGLSENLTEDDEFSGYDVS